MDKEFKKAFSGMSFLVCGGCGFMGSNFIHYLFKMIPGVTVVNADLLTFAGNKNNLKDIPKRRYRFIRADIADEKKMKRLMKSADYVVNFAAETHVDRSIHHHAGSFLHSNVIGVEALLKALQSSSRVSKMVHISTDEVWGDLSLDSKKKFNEESPFRPNSPYAASKAAADLLIRSFVKTYGLPVIVSHSVNNFGPRQFPEKLIPFFYLRLSQGKTLPLYGDGKNVRDWIHVDDHTRAILTLLLKGVPGDVFAISRGEEYSNIEIAKKLLKAMKKPASLITFVKDRPGHDRRYSVDCARIRRLGWKPKYSLKQELQKTIQWYQKNSAWLADVVRRQPGINTHIRIT